MWRGRGDISHLRPFFLSFSPSVGGGKTRVGSSSWYPWELCVFLSFPLLLARWNRELFFHLQVCDWVGEREGSLEVLRVCFGGKEARVNEFWWGEPVISHTYTHTHSPHLKNSTPLQQGQERLGDPLFLFLSGAVYHWMSNRGKLSPLCWTCQNSSG